MKNHFKQKPQEYYEDDAAAEKQRPLAETTCPECGGKALVWRVRQGQKRNIGRPILFCQDRREEGCRLAKFMDLPNCAVCGAEMYEAQAKTARNNGRWFQTCPNRCAESFWWVK